MILFFDTETTGFTRPRLSLSDPLQPHIVQLAAQLCDEKERPVSGFSLIVNPGVEIPEQVADIHGITTEKAAQLGVTLLMAMTLFEHLYRRADLLVAHNIKFDKAVMETAMTRNHGKETRIDKPLFCTMEKATPIVNLPPTDKMRAAGMTCPKAPKLAECIKHFFDEELDGAHDAMVDTIACARVYFHLKTLEANP